MNSSSITMLVLIVISLGSVLFAARRMLSGRLGGGDFRKQFYIAWGSAGMLAVGATWVIMSAPGLNRNITQIAGVAGFLLGCFMMTTYPMSWLAWRLYDRSETDPDFADDESGNPAPGPPPDMDTDLRIENWRVSGGGPCLNG